MKKIILLFSLLVSFQTFAGSINVPKLTTKIQGEPLSISVSWECEKISFMSGFSDDGRLPCGSEKKQFERTKDGTYILDAFEISTSGLFSKKIIKACLNIEGLHSPLTLTNGKKRTCFRSDKDENIGEKLQDALPTNRYATLIKGSTPVTLQVNINKDGKVHNIHSARSNGFLWLKGNLEFNSNETAYITGGNNKHYGMQFIEKQITLKNGTQATKITFTDRIYVTSEPIRTYDLRLNVAALIKSEKLGKQISLSEDIVLGESNFNGELELDSIKDIKFKFDATDSL